MYVYCLYISLGNLSISQAAMHAETFLIVNNKFFLFIVRQSSKAKI